MKSQEYSLFPQPRTQPQSSYQQENLFSPQQNWRVTTTNKTPAVQVQTQPAFLPIVPSSVRVSQLPVNYVLTPQPIIPVRSNPQIPQQKIIYHSPQQLSQQGYQEIQQQQSQNKEIKQIQEKVQEQAQQQLQQQQPNPIHSYRQQLIQEQVRSEQRNEKQKEIEKKIHEEILSQSKRVHPSQRVQQTQSPFKQTKTLLQSINIHHNERDLHIQKQNQNQIYEQHNQQYNQQPSNLLISRSYVQLPQQPTAVQCVSPLVNSQIRAIQSPVVPITGQLLTSQVRVLQPLNPPIAIATSTATTRLIPTKTSKLIINQIGASPVTSVSSVLTPQSQLFSQQVIRQSPVTYGVPLVLSQQQQSQNIVKVSQIIQSPKNQISQVNEFAINSGFRSFQTDRDNFQRNPDFIKSIDGGFGTERVTKANKTETDLNTHQQQVRQIIQQSKFLLQNDILPKNEELNQQYQGLKQYEKLSLQNRQDQDKFFQDFEMRRMQFNKKLQQCSQPSNAELNEFEDQKNIQSNLYMIHQQRVQFAPAQEISHIAVSQNISLQNNRSQQQNLQKAQQVPKNLNLPTESQTLKQPILTEYEQSLIIQQQSTSNFPNSSRNQIEKTASTSELRDKNYQGQTKEETSEQYETTQGLDLNNIQTPSNNQLKESEKKQQNNSSDNNYRQDEELEDNQNYQQPEPSISNQINQQDISRSSTVHQAIEKDVVYSQQHQEFKQKFLKSKDQFYQEKSQLSDRSKQIQQSQTQESENKDLKLVQQQQQLSSVVQANQQLKDQITNNNLSQQSNRYQLIDEDEDQQNTAGINQQQLQQQQQEQNNNSNQQNQALGQQQQQLIQQQNIQQIQQQYLLSRGQANEQLLNQINNNDEEYQLGDLASHQAHVQAQQDQQKHQQNQEEQQQQINLNNDQQQYLQNRGQINDLFLHSLENKYQKQFNQEEEFEDENYQNHQEEEQDEEYEQNHQEDNYQDLIDQDENNQYEHQILPRENFESEEEYQRYLQEQQEYFNIINQQHQILTPGHFDNEEDYNQYISQIQKIQQIQQQNLNLQLMQQQYLVQRGDANEELMQQFYQNQQYQQGAASNNHNQQGQEDLINFDDYQNQENIQQQNQNIQDMDQEFENEHNQQINTKIHNQQFQQQILNQQINQQGNHQFIQQQMMSQNQQVNSPQHYDDEERLVMLREQQLLQEKKKREEERQQKIQQIEQDELLRLSSHSLGNKKNSLNPDLI
ncbi:hypothetical protein TTHERM_00257250 (macronuclear) [Tetrahymena thermophila SB210]|uniref:Uncharacterized protein n=1 Tax=Tetrahymena thermophila (strain SB210) TaxID=312017 RepID=Q23QF3_TETTS|nr:hypothetical protein TTHERM_00257250 [Tetrahymena thermophila SB210]EAR98935.2 hypothetical protein TTHERM_00257250 [Tetrahymena thermophila SB210]|eukprot:XP_001019180.2 hypothetical protein TTHERM_00257250 [Tetrahymena thermophila SB210]